MARDITCFANSKIEKEVLFKRNAFFKIINVVEHLVEMKEVTETNNAIKLIGYYFE